LNQWRVVPDIPFAIRVDMGIFWSTVSKAADRSSKMSTEDLQGALDNLRDSITKSKAVSLGDHF